MQAFDSLQSSGTNVSFTNNATLTGWYSSRTTYNAGTGSSTTGSLYSFGVAGTNALGDRALGALASSGTSTIHYGLRLRNTGTTDITSLAVSFRGEQWRDGGSAAPQTLNFSYRISESAITDLTTGTYTDADALDFTSPQASASASALDGNASGNFTDLASSIAVTIPPNWEIMLRWSDVDDPGADHGLAIDGLSVVATFVDNNAPVIAPSTTGLNFGAVTVGTSSTQTYTITGTNLTEGVSVSVPAASGYLISSDGTTFGTMASLPSSGGTVTVEFTPTSAVAYNGVLVTHTSAGASTKTVTLNGSGAAAVAPDAPTNLGATAGDQSVQLAWVPATSGVAPTGYRVFRSTTSGSFPSPAIATLSESAVTYTDTGLVNGTRYYYVVQALNASMASASSFEAEATPSNVTTTLVPPVFGYYGGLTASEFASAAALKSALSQLVDAPDPLSYSGTAAPVQDIHENPADSASVLDFYTGLSRLKSDFGGLANGSPTTGEWSREHLWPQSSFADAEPYRSDLFALFPVDQDVNQGRSNSPYDLVPTATHLDGYGSRWNTSTGRFEPRPFVRGNIARAMMYMDTRYEGNNGEIYNLALTNSPSTANGAGESGVLSTLVQWHLDDPVTLDERGFNAAVAGYQAGNRNPFIDYPWMGTYIFGGGLANVPPAPPQNVTATKSSNDVVLDWGDSPEGDVASYQVWRTTTLSDWGAAPYQSGLTQSVYTDLDAGLTTYHYAVVAVDSAGNPSPTSLVVRSVGRGVFINELHYDNTGTDVNELVEVAGPAGTDLSTYSIVLYDGSSSLSYGTINLTGVIPNQQGGYGTMHFPRSGIQNGPNDGLALVQYGEVIQFLSYEGTVTGGDGPALNMPSTDIGRSQPGTEAAGLSLQLQGSGYRYEDFTWSSASVTETPGLVNVGQTFQGPPPPARVEGWMVLGD